MCESHSGVLIANSPPAKNHIEENRAQYNLHRNLDQNEHKITGTGDVPEISGNEVIDSTYKIAGITFVGGSRLVLLRILRLT